MNIFLNYKNKISDMSNENEDEGHPVMRITRGAKFVTRTKKPWNQRFHIMTSKDNQKLHLFYKELFGKPSHVKYEEVLLADKSKPNFMFGTSYNPLSFNKTTKSMRKTMSQDHLEKNNFKENKWVSNFSIMGSKNNDRVHRHYQEYFDRPVEYDNQGYKPGIGKFGIIYDKFTPLKLK